MAVPVAIGVALYISHYAPRRLATMLGYLDRPARRGAERRLRPVGHRLPRPQLVPLYEWLKANLGFLPFFAGPASATGRTILTAASCWP